MIDYDQYYQKGGTYVIPIEVFNDLLGELEELHNNINKLKNELERYQQAYHLLDMLCD